MSLSPKAIYDWYGNTLRHPKYRWWLILGTLAYVISPIDLAPDFLPIAGQVDDVMLVTLLVTELSQIVLEFFKTRRSEKSPAQNAETNQSDQTVDINAVAMDEGSV
ncbi:MAG: YkvA family protein [Limnothrix sp.]